MIAARKTEVYNPKNISYGNPATRVSRTPKGQTPRREHTGAQSTWRDSNDYRREYFDNNKGIGGYGYICSQCFKPLFKRASIQVDHIIPPSRFAVTKRRKGQWVKTSIMARFLNHSFNCAAICGDCNRRKSNSMDVRILRGYMMKSLEVAYGIGQVALSIPIMTAALGMFVVNKIATGIFRAIKGGSKRR